MKPSQSSQLVALALLLIMVFGGVFFVLPMRTSIAGLKVQKRTASEELTGLQTEYDALAALANEVSNSQTTKDSLLKAVPKGYGQDALLLDLSSLANEVGFTLNAMNFSAGTNVDLGNTITVTTNLNGSYDQLVSFLQKLETADRLMQVKSLSVQRTSNTAVSFNLQIEAYYQ